MHITALRKDYNTGICKQPLVFFLYRHAFILTMQWSWSCIIRCCNSPRTVTTYQYWTGFSHLHNNSTFFLKQSLIIVFPLWCNRTFRFSNSSTEVPTNRPGVHQVIKCHAAWTPRSTRWDQEIRQGTSPRGTLHLPKHGIYL